MEEEGGREGRGGEGRGDIKAAADVVVKGLRVLKEADQRAVDEAREGGRKGGREGGKQGAINLPTCLIALPNRRGGCKSPYGLRMGPEWPMSREGGRAIVK